jgi:Ca2+-transporting ATPase
MAPATPSETFCQKTIQQTIDELRTNPDRGLTSAEVDLRRVTYGTNELVVDDDEPLYMKFIDQLKQPLILLLFASAFISLILNQADNAFSITLVG